MTSTTATSETPVKNEQTTSLSPPTYRYVFTELVMMISEKDFEARDVSPSTLPTTSTFENMNENDSDSNVFTELVHEQMMISDKDFEARDVSPSTLPTTSTFEFNNILLGPMWNRLRGNLYVSPSTLPTISTFENMNENEDSNVFTELVHEQMMISDKDFEERNVSPSTLPTISTFENINENEDSNVFTELAHEQMMISEKDLEERNVPTTTETSSRAIRCNKFGWKEYYANFNNMLLGPLWNRIMENLLEEEEENEKECEKFKKMLID
jgi:hypothetical protein